MCLTNSSRMGQLCVKPSHMRNFHKLESITVLNKCSPCCSFSLFKHCCLFSGCNSFKEFYSKVAANFQLKPSHTSEIYSSKIEGFILYSYVRCMTFNVIIV